MKLILATAWLIVTLISSALGQPARSKPAQDTSLSAGAYFMFTDGKDTFIFKLTDPKRIQEARDILAGKEKRNVHVSGIIVTQAAPYNSPWHYYLKPESVSFFQNSIEVCDSTIRNVEEHLSEVGGAFLPGNRWCPWVSRLVKEVSSTAQTLSLMDSVAGSEPRLTGGFIQLGDAEKRLPRGKWEELLGEMKGKLGMDTVLVQALFFQDAGKHSFIVLKQGTINPDNPQYDPRMVLSGDDPTDAILEYADHNGIKVYLGLWMQEIEYGKVTGTVPELESFLSDAARKSNAAAELIWNLYHRHPSFQGWYIPYELWNFPIGQDQQRNRKQELFRQFLASVSAKCDELNARKEANGQGVERPVAVSAYFNPWFDQGMAGPQVTTDAFTSILTGAGIDTLILQDSVGAKCLGNEKLDSAAKESLRAEIKRRIMPEYLRAFYEAAKAASPQGRRILLWNDMEAYETVSGRCPAPRVFDKPEAALPFKPSNIERLKWQFLVATRDPATNEPYVDFETDQPIQLFDKFIVFDSFHYMNTVIPEGFGTDAANTRQLRSALFNDYKREFVDKSFQPTLRELKEPQRRKIKSRSKD